MIINNQQSTIFGSVTESNGFSIKSSPKAFQILSSNLYSNKIRAVIREYSCNALDAHRYAGCEDKPFKVTLPTRLELNFSVRDYGNGLSPDEIKELFTTYFSSSKDKSNDFTGALGLGSKSAFSYTNTFSCKSYHNGVMYVYSLFLDAGEPKVTLMHSTKSTEPSGVEIIIPVNSDDIYKFEEEANYVYSAFDVIPECNLELTIHRNQLIGNLGIVKTSISSRDYALARMGNVFYPIDMNMFNAELDKLRDIFLSRANNINLYIDFDIGDLDIAPSREQLSYDETTIKNIQNKLAKIEEYKLAGFFSEFKDELNSCKTWIEYFNKAKDILAKNTFSEGYILGKYRINSILDWMKTLKIELNGCTFIEYYHNFGDKFFKSDKFMFSTYKDNPSGTPYAEFYYVPDRFRSRPIKEVVLVHKLHMEKDNLFEDCEIDDNAVIVLVPGDFKGLKTFSFEYLQIQHPTKTIVLINSPEKFILDEFRNYLDLKYKDTKLVHFDFDDNFINTLKAAKKPNRVVKQKNLLANCYVVKKKIKDRHDVLKAPCSEVMGFYGIAEFRKFLSENPNTVFVKFETGWNSKFIFSFGGSRFHTSSTKEFNKILDSLKNQGKQLVIIRDSFRWYDLLIKNKKILNIKDLLKINVCKLSEESIAKVMLSIGYFISDCYSLRYCHLTKRITKFIKLTDDEQKLYDEVIELILTFNLLQGNSDVSKQELTDYLLGKHRYEPVSLSTIPEYLLQVLTDDSNKVLSLMTQQVNELFSRVDELKFIQKILGLVSNKTWPSYQRFFENNLEYLEDFLTNKLTKG